MPGRANPILSSRFDEALAFAVELHREQPRKGTGVPYVSHLLSVAALVLEHGGSEDQAIAALLHDAVEDQGGRPTAERIRERFGDLVADIVDGCTDTDVSPKPPWRERKAAYLARVRGEPAHVRLVSAADKLHNARTMVTDLRIHGPALWERFNAGRDETLWYLESLVAAFREAGSTPIVEELARTVAELRLVSGNGHG
ncbi:MAG TPA: HD domain-containing protein [Thermoanaerobaculia bacterium]|jgi:(p)ppGpp synthase/HD superfamily hydrolase|nr:HD domain-containing protein [Thermoanaerobaculia bacterium]HQN09000.1 HD domain-containing protein [Thermoanaerobaculia bacterium]HQP86463.1 HD domain-containing protein [Thermoanaerobaculia bacterium]